MSVVIPATDVREWRTHLDVFARADVCHMPEYHQTYETRTDGAKAVMWCFEEGSHQFCYPFLLTNVVLGGADGAIHQTAYSDISSIYGYSGPLSTTDDKDFLERAWRSFDEWCAGNRVIAEFIRFSVYADNRHLAHADCIVESNREVAVSFLPDSDEDLLQGLGKKTRNMIRKAEQSGLIACELDVREWLPAFRSLYDETMRRNQSPSFFDYNDRYYDLLLSLPQGELQLFGVFQGDRFVSSAMALVHGQGALYHLGASLQEFSSLGAGNLGMYEMSRSLRIQGVKFLNVGGGRTTDADDPLLRFKKSNATGTAPYYIGKRVVNSDGYREVAKIWQDLYKTTARPEKLIFYR
jgi:hypothetical protein